MDSNIKVQDTSSKKRERLERKRSGSHKSWHRHTSLHFMCTHFLEGMSAMPVGRMRGSENTKRFISSQGKTNRAIKPSCHEPRICWWHTYIYTHVLRDKSEPVQQIKPSLLFISGFVRRHPPFHLFTALLMLVRWESLMFSWAVMTALTALICLKGQDERQGRPIKGCHLGSGGRSGCVRGRGTYLSFFICKVKGFVKKVGPKLMLLSFLSPASLSIFLSIHFYHPQFLPLPSMCLSAVWFSTCGLVTHWAEEDLQPVEVYGWVSVGRHWCLGGRLLLDWQICPHRPFPFKKTGDTKHRKWKEVQSLEYKWYTTGVVNNWEMLDN